ncbi:MAG: hypothetical protein HY902_04350 [Deltaproteobacteria bacterium]|nr:hypothetical protein [Deltaproteobacteria bacterium]
MADHARFDLFADFLTQRFAAPRIWDVAGGMGKLNQALVARGRQCTTFDVRWKHLPNLDYREQLLELSEPCQCDLIVGLHADGATRIIVEYAAQHGIPFAIVPCCSDNGMPYKPWLRHLAELAQDLGMATERRDLAMRGRCTMIVGTPKPT